MLWLCTATTYLCLDLHLATNLTTRCTTFTMLWLITLTVMMMWVISHLPSSVRRSQCWEKQFTTVTWRISCIHKITKWENLCSLCYFPWTDPLIHFFSILWYLGSSTLQFRAERIKIPPTRYPRSTGSDRGTVEHHLIVTAVNNKSELIPFSSATPGSLSHSECSSPTPPMSPVNLETSSFTSSQSQSSISIQPRISVSPAPVGDRRKDG